MGRLPGHPRGSQGKWYSFGISFFPAEEGSCLVLETISLDHLDIPTGFVWGSATGKVKNALPGTMVDVRKWAKSEQKKPGYLLCFICYFCQRKVNIILKSDSKRLKKVVMLSLTTCKRYYVVGAHTSLLGNGYLSLILCPLPRGFE